MTLTPEQQEHVDKFMSFVREEEKIFADMPDDINTNIASSKPKKDNALLIQKVWSKPWQKQATGVIFTLLKLDTAISVEFYDVILKSISRLQKNGPMWFE